MIHSILVGIFAFPHNIHTRFRIFLPSHSVGITIIELVVNSLISGHLFFKSDTQKILNDLYPPFL